MEMATKRKYCVHSRIFQCLNISHTHVLNALNNPTQVTCLD